MTSVEFRLPIPASLDGQVLVIPGRPSICSKCRPRWRAHVRVPWPEQRFELRPPQGGLWINTARDSSMNALEKARRLLVIDFSTNCDDSPGSPSEEGRGEPADLGAIGVAPESRTACSKYDQTEMGQRKAIEVRSRENQIRQTGFVSLPCQEDSSSTWMRRIYDSVTRNVEHRRRRELAQDCFAGSARATEHPSSRIDPV